MVCTEALAWATESGGGSLGLEGLAWLAALEVAGEAFGEECARAVWAAGEFVFLGRSRLRVGVLAHLLATLLAVEELSNGLHELFRLVGEGDAVLLGLVELINVPLLLALLDVLDDLSAWHFVVANVTHDAAHFLILTLFQTFKRELTPE